MCNLYSLKSSRNQLGAKFRMSDNRMEDVPALPGIFPGHMAPIIRRAEDGARELTMRSWGFILLRDGYAPKRVTNTRDDKAYTKFWKDSFVNRRCLVPVTAFAEPDEGKPAKWHWFTLGKTNEQRPLFAFAGVWRQWKGPLKKDGANVDVEVFSFMMTLPNTLTETINHERSPVLLTEETEYETWLTGTHEAAFGLIKTSDPEKMRIVQSGLDKLDLLAAAA